MQNERRPIRAFMLALLVGLLACLPLYLVFAPPRGGLQAPVIFLYIFAPVFGVPIYAGTWIVGLPLYLVLRRTRHLRPIWFVSVFAVVGILIVEVLTWPKWYGPGARALVPVAALTGAVTGAAFVQLLIPARTRSTSQPDRPGEIEPDDSTSAHQHDDR